MQNVESGRFSAPQCGQYRVCAVAGVVGGSGFVGVFMAKNALAGNIHARLLIVEPVDVMANAAVEDIVVAKNRRTPMHARTTVSMLLATSATPAFLNEYVSDLAASRLNACIMNND